MPKSIEVLPERFADREPLQTPDIPVYLYRKTLAQARAEYPDNTLRQVLRQMLILRQFETMLQEIRSRGEFNGIQCAYRGPAHLSVGQEASAVGLALALQPDDHVFGNHRSHGDALAKGLSVIQQCNDNELGDRMMQHPVLLQMTERALGGEGKTLAENFLLLGFLCEVLMRDCGFNRGMGGSMHAFYTPFGIYPNNAIVAGSAGIATGAAMAKRQSADGITVSVTGDGATGCGQTFEAMNFASMGQFRSLWQDAEARGLPVLFYFTNNFYAMGGQTMGETMGWDRLSRIAAGINQSAMHAETVDGTNPLAVADAVSRKRALLMRGEGPVLLDVECYRYSGHSTTDANAYRSRDEMNAWQQHDGLARFASELQEAGVIDAAEYEHLRCEVADLIARVLTVAADTSAVPPVKSPAVVGELMFNHTSQTLPEQPLSGADADQCSRLRQLGKKSRAGLNAHGNPLSPMRAVTLRDSLFEAVLYHLQRDPLLKVYGEECREWGGAFGVYRGLSDLFPHQQLFNAPISEATIVSTAVGYAMEGGRALVELMYADFIGRAGDEIFNQLSKWQAMSGGQLQLPVVLRCSIGSKYGAQHSQDWTSLVAHIPGLKVVYPATPYDAKGLLAAALAANDPVVFFESQRLYDAVEIHRDEGVPSDYYQLNIGEPEIKRTGDALTVLTVGPCLHPAIAAANRLAAEWQLETEIIDARSLVPFNYELLLNSVRKTGYLIIVTEACERGSFAATVAANVTREVFGSLRAAPLVLGAPNWIVPGAEMDATYFPQADDILTLTSRFYPDIGIPAATHRSYDTLAQAGRGL